MGGDIDAFWRQTPRTYSLFIRGRERAAEDAARASLTQAWYFAGLSRMDKLMPLDRLLPPRHKGGVGPQTDNDMLAAGAALAAELGGRFTPANE